MTVILIIPFLQDIHTVSSRGHRHRRPNPGQVCTELTNHSISGCGDDIPTYHAVQIQVLLCKF